MHAHLERRGAITFLGAALFAGVAAGQWRSTTGEWQMTGTIAAAAAAYFDAWTRKDLDAIAARVHPDVHFKGPMNETRGRQAYVEASRRILPLLQRFELHAQFVSDTRAMAAYDFICIEPIGICRTAELLGFEDGLIRDSEVFFDARPFEAFMRAQAHRPPGQ